MPEISEPNGNYPELRYQQANAKLLYMSMAASLIFAASWLTLTYLIDDTDWIGKFIMQLSLFFFGICSAELLIRLIFLRGTAITITKHGLFDNRFSYSFMQWKDIESIKIYKNKINGVNVDGVKIILKDKNWVQKNVDPYYRFVIRANKIFGLKLDYFLNPSDVDVEIDDLDFQLQKYFTKFGK